MAETKLGKTRLRDGIWEGVLTLGKEFDAAPPLKALHHDKPLDGLEVKAEPQAGRFIVRLPIPARLLSDEVQTVLLVNGDTGDVLNSVTILAGDAMADDIRSEMELLRAELDMLKRAFRRHCVETM